MRVRCVFHGPWNEKEEIPSNQIWPVYGEIYDVLETYLDFEGEWYILAGWTKYDLWNQKYFVPLGEFELLSSLLVEKKELIS